MAERTIVLEKTSSEGFGFTINRQVVAKVRAHWSWGGWGAEGNRAIEIDVPCVAKRTQQ